MRKVFVVAVLFVILFSVNSVYAADKLQVQKLVENSDIKTGDDVKIILKFTNPFGKDIPIKIEDKNIFGNNGIDIQCFEYTVPAQKQTAIAYQPVKPFSPGKYTLDSAKITYTNPETGKEETVESNTLDLNVKDSGKQMGQAQGITTIYRCNGMNMQSTSYSSSGSSINIQMGGSSTMISQQVNQMFNQPQNQNPQNAGSRVQNNQMNQNTGALKKQMEEQIKQQKQMEREFQQALANNPDFQKEHQQLLRQGYNLTDGSFKPVTNNTGDFELTYQRGNETATLKGEMNNGTIKDIMLFTSQDEKKMLEALMRNKQFQYYDSYLKSEGFNMTRPSFNYISQNYTQITVPYKNSKDEERDITADYINGTIRNVSLEGEELGSFNWWPLLAIPLIGALGWLFYTKYFRKPPIVTEPHKIEIAEKPIDYFAEAMKMIREAEELFSAKMEKDAYEKVSQAVRFYLSHKLGIKKEVINSEIVSFLRKAEHELYSDVKRCLDLCSMVEFAKYKANKTDFDEILQISKKIIR